MAALQRCGAEVERQLRAGCQVGIIRRADAEQRVVPEAAAQDRGRIRAHDGIVARAGIDEDAGAAAHRNGIGTAGQAQRRQVREGGSLDRGGAARDGYRARVGRRRRDRDGVAAETAQIEHVVAAAAVDRVGAAAGRESLRARRALEGIVAGCADDRSEAADAIAAAARLHHGADGAADIGSHVAREARVVERVRAVATADKRVVAGAADDRIVACARVDGVAAGAADDEIGLAGALDAHTRRAGARVDVLEIRGRADRRVDVAAAWVGDRANLARRVGKIDAHRRARRELQCVGAGACVDAAFGPVDDDRVIAAAADDRIVAAVAIDRGGRRQGRGDRFRP